MADQRVSDNIANWDFRKYYVQSNVDPGGSFIRGASVLLAAGPPSLAQATFNRSSGADTQGVVNELTEARLARAYPIGLVDNMGVNQSKGLQQIFEIGSDRRYFVPGRTVNSFSMSRVMFDGNSLMKVLYNDYFSAGDPYSQPNPALPTGSGDSADTAVVGLDPGFGKTFLNLGSDLFNRPIGLLMVINNLNNESVAAVYLEYCFLQAHQMNINSSSTLFAEQIQGQFDRVMPINMNFARLFGDEVA
jgi:hypothetical protein